MYISKLILYMRSKVVLITIFGAVFLFALSAIKISTGVGANHLLVNAKNSLANIMDECFGYRSDMGQNIPQCIVSESSVPIHSWRAIIYNRMKSPFDIPYNFDFPWNHQKNQQCLKSDKKPFSYDQTSEKYQEGETNIVMVLPNDNTATNGNSFLILAELPLSGIKWTEPKDLTFSELLDLVKKLRERKDIFLSMKDSKRGIVLMGEDYAHGFLTTEGELIYLPKKGELSFCNDVVIPKFWEDMKSSN